MLNGTNQLTQPIKVAFLLIGGRQWMGGYNYLLNLLSVIKDDERIQPVLFLGNDIDASLLHSLQDFGYEIVYDDIFNLSIKQRVVITATLFGKNNYIEKIFSNNNIDVVFEAAMYLGWRTKIPRLSWIPDFQHRYLVQMFSKVGWLRRDIVFRLIGLNRTIMLSSQDAKNDYLNFYGNPKFPIQVVPFAVQKPYLDEENIAQVLKKYNIQEPYFYLPNQFWQHKNHKIVIEAIGKLKKQDIEITIISSGKCDDERTSTHCDSLKKLIQNYDVNQNFIMLGTIPYQDVLSLIKMSCALINPSYFEGWSTTVEEAKTMGAPLILSNISVHQEQVGKKALFFVPDSSDELSKILKEYSCDTKQNMNYYDLQTEPLENFKNNFVSGVMSALNQDEV